MPKVKIPTGLLIVGLALILALPLAAQAQQNNPYGQPAAQPQWGGDGQGAPAGGASPMTPPQGSPGMPQGQPQGQPPGGGMGTYGQQPVLVPGPTLADALGHFQVRMPQGAQAFGATYNYGIPQMGIQISIMSVGNPQMFQMYRQNFNQMISNMGAQAEAPRPLNAGAQQGELVVATMNNPQNGQQMVAYNAFLPQAGVWIQVMGPGQARQSVETVVNMLVGNLQSR
ncbi:MAG: hypothetical protein KQJ78_12880 [Deltaproteobacteria bacterium]|nr:hypothetical protein [Deltaproteobacteria bacterium]